MEKQVPDGPPKGKILRGVGLGHCSGLGLLPGKPIPTRQYMLFLAAQGYKLGVLYISALMHKVPKGQFLPRGSMTPWLLWEQWPDSPRSQQPEQCQARWHLRLQADNHHHKHMKPQQVRLQQQEMSHVDFQQRPGVSWTGQ